MNKAQIAENLRKEVGELEVMIQKLQNHCGRLKKFVLELEEEIAGPPARKPEVESKFRKAIDRVFGEKPKPRKR